MPAFQCPPSLFALLLLLVDFHEKAGACQAPGGVAVKVARLQHSATPFALLPSALLASPGLQGSVPVEVPRKGGCCHLETMISKDQSLARSHPNAAVHCRVVTTIAADLRGKLLGLLAADARLGTGGSAKNSSVQLMRLSLKIGRAS